MRSLWFAVLLNVVAFSVAAQAPPDPNAPLAVSDEQEEKVPKKVTETIVVTATRSEREVSELPVSTTVVTEEVLQTAPANTLDDLLRGMAGVNVPAGSSQTNLSWQSDFSMRGLGETRALVLVDGVPLHDPYQGTVQWQRMAVEDVRQVEVVRGASASLFGNHALGGAVNVITKGVDSSNVRLDLAGGSAGTERGVLTVDQMLTPRLGVRLSQTYLDTAGTFRQPEPRPIDIRAWNDTKITSARLDFDRGDGARTYLKVSDAQFDISAGTPAAHADRELSDLAIGGHEPVGTRHLLTYSLFRQNGDEFSITSLINPARTTETVSTVADIPSSQTGGAADWSMQRSGALPFISFGVDYQELEADEHRDTFNRSGVLTRKNLAGGRQQFAGAYVQTSWQPHSRFELLTSARLDYYRNSEGHDRIIGGTAREFPTATSTQFDPRISARFALTGNSALRASVYRGFNAPSLRDLYRETQGGITTLLPNPYLEPETLVGGEIGAEWALQRARFEVNIYQNNLEGAQVRIQAPGQTDPNVSILSNLGETRARGLEAMANLRIARDWSVDAAYTYSDSIITHDSDPAVIGNRVPQIPMHIGTLSLRYLARGGTSLMLRGRITSSSYGEPTNVVASPANRVVDISVRRPIGPHFEVYGLVENVFDERYWWVLTATTVRAAQPRLITAGVRVNFPTGLLRGL